MTNRRVFIHIAVCAFCVLIIAFTLGTLNDDNRHSVTDHRAWREPVADDSGDAYEDGIESMTYPVSEGFLVLKSGGAVSVYDAKTGDYLFESGIPLDALIDDMADSLSDGIYFPDESGLYDFLENYTS